MASPHSVKKNSEKRNWFLLLRFVFPLGFTHEKTKHFSGFLFYTLPQNEKETTEKQRGKSFKVHVLLQCLKESGEKKSDLFSFF